jgi:hypothetical protein
MNHDANEEVDVVVEEEDDVDVDEEVDVVVEEEYDVDVDEEVDWSLL